MDDLSSIAASHETLLLEKVVEFAHSLNSSNETTTIERLPDFPVENVQAIARIVETNPSALAFDLIHRLYPFDAFLSSDAQKSLRTLFNSLQIHVPETGADGSFLWSWTKGGKKTKQSVVSVRPGDEQTNRAGPHHIGTQNFTTLQ